MNFYRIVAVYIEDSQAVLDSKITLVLPLSGKNELIDGQWSGNASVDNINHPFLLNVSNFQVQADYGWDVESELINITKEKIKVGGYFSVISLPESKEKYSYLYKITSIYTY